MWDLGRFMHDPSSESARLVKVFTDRTALRKSKLNRLLILAAFYYLSIDTQQTETLLDDHNRRRLVPQHGQSRFNCRLFFLVYVKAIFSPDVIDIAMQRSTRLCYDGVECKKIFFRHCFKTIGGGGQ